VLKMPYSARCERAPSRHEEQHFYYYFTNDLLRTSVVRTVVVEAEGRRKNHV